MANNNIESTIMVAESDNLYLIYDGMGRYVLADTSKEKTTFAQPPNTMEAPLQLVEVIDGSTDIDKTLTEIINKPRTKKSESEKDLTFLQSLIASHTEKNPNIVLEVFIQSLADTQYQINEEGRSYTNDYILTGLPTEVADKVETLSEEITQAKNSIIYLADGGKKGKIVQFNNNPAMKDGLYYETSHTNKKGEYITEHNLIGNILIHSLSLTYDKLNLFNPVATIKYTNTTTGQTVTIDKQPYEAIADNLLNNRLIKSNNLGIESLLNNIWVDGVNNHDFITAETDLLKDGFFIDSETGKVLSNNVFENLNSTTDDVKQAVNLFNEIIKDRGTAIPNDCTLFRFMLWSPFAYCLKQLGFIDDLYSMVLWGVTDTNKTGSSVMLSNLYTDKATTLQKANTQSAIGTRLGENTFPLILDEAKDNLTNPADEEFNKNIVTDEIGRAVKDRTNNNLMVGFPALRLTVRTLNQDIEYKDEFLKRHKVLYYDKSMQVKESDKKEFNRKYKPNSPNTPLKQLKHIGKAFAERFIPYLESQSDELYDLEDLTIKILSEIEKDFQVSFNMNVKIKQKLTNQSRDTGSIIQNGLNNLFTKAYRLPYGHTGYMEQDFIDAVNMGSVNWLDYQSRNELFIIKVADFEKTISNIVGQHIPIAETMKLLNIKYEYKERVKFKGGSFPCVKLDTYNLTYKLFGINIYTFEELEELQAEEEEIQQREAEADKILNREAI